jgi:hypothetical protein
MTKKSFLFAAALALVAVSFANAQVDSGNYVMYNWGTAHMVPGQAIVLNFAVSDQGAPIAVQVEFSLQDKNGNTVYRNAMTMLSGQAISLAVGPETRTTAGTDIRQTISADLYAITAPDIRVLVPRLKVTYPPGPSAPVDRLTPTLELMDAVTGRALGFANNPHAIIGVLSN